MVSPLVFLALDTQSGHCVGDDDRLVVVGCLALGICLWHFAAISTWNAAIGIDGNSSRLGLFRVRVYVIRSRYFFYFLALF
jgi:hypothetical protein